MDSPDHSRQRERFEVDGFLHREESGLSIDVLHAANRGLDRIMDGVYETGQDPEPSPWSPGAPEGQLVKVELPQRADWGVRELVSQACLGEWIAELTGAAWVQVWWTQMLVKPPASRDQSGGPRVGWHQDWQYWRSTWEEGSELLTLWVALSEVTVDSGPLIHLRASREWGLVEGGDFFSQADLRGQFVLPPGASWDEQPALLPLGGVSLHDRFTLHGSAANRSASPRRSLALHVRTERSAPLGGGRSDLARFIDDLEVCPVIFGEKRPR